MTESTGAQQGGSLQKKKTTKKTFRDAQENVGRGTSFLSAPPPPSLTHPPPSHTFLVVTHVK